MKIRLWSRLPIRRQLMLAVNGMLLLVVVLFLFVGHASRIRDAKREKRIALSEEAKTVYESVNVIANRGNEAIQKLIDDVCARMNNTESPGHHIVVQRRGIKFQARSHGRASLELLRAMQAEAGSSGEPVPPVANHTIIVGSFTGSEGTVYVAESTESVFTNARQELIRQVTAVLVAGALAGLMVQFVLRKVVTKPLRRLVTSLQRVGAGDLTVVTAEQSCAELSYLSDQVNEMTRRLQASDRDRRLHMKKAREIQQHLRPCSGSARGTATTELFQPAEDVGGDYYDVIPLSEHRCLLCLADVSGHGVPAAMAATVIKALILEAIEVTTSPAEILTRVNRRYSEIILPGIFATMVIVLLDSGEHILTCSNAGHEPPFLYEPGKHVTRLEEGDLMLGVDEDTEYTEQTRSICFGTKIVLVSDGVTETFSPEDEPFGTERVVEITEKHRDAQVEELVQHFSSALAQFRRWLPALDDTTLLVAEVTAEKPVRVARKSAE